MKIFKMSPSRGRSDTYFGSYERFKKSYDRVFDACVASWAIGVDRHLTIIRTMEEEMMITTP